MLFDEPCKTGRLQVDEMTVRVVDPLQQLLWSTPRNSVTYIGLQMGPSVANLTVYTAQYTFPASGLAKQRAQQLLTFFPGVPVGLPVHLDVQELARSSSLSEAKIESVSQGSSQPLDDMWHAPTLGQLPPFQPPPIQLHQKGVLGWYRRQNSAIRIVSLLAATFLILIICGTASGVVINAVSGATATSAPTTASNDAATATADAQQTACCTAPTSAPTDIPTQAATPTSAPTTAPVPSGLPATHGTPRLGGPLSDFIGAYGQPNSNSNPPLFDFQEVNNINGVSIMGLGSSCSSTQCEVEQQIDNITVQSPDQANGYTMSEANVRCMVFAPTDARFKQKVPYGDGTGYDMIYSSTSLAKEFPASEFIDANSNQVAAGTFDVSYLYANNKAGIGNCDMITGESQTNG